MALGADHVQATGLTHAPLFLLDNRVVFSFHSVDRIPQGLDLKILGWSFLCGGGDALLQFNHGENPVAPSLDQVTYELAEGLVGVVG